MATRPTARSRPTASGWHTSPTKPASGRCLSLPIPAAAASCRFRAAAARSLVGAATAKRFSISIRKAILSSVAVNSEGNLSTGAPHYAVSDTCPRRRFLQRHVQLRCDPRRPALPGRPLCEAGADATFEHHPERHHGARSHGALNCATPSLASSGIQSENVKPCVHWTSTSSVAPRSKSFRRTMMRIARNLLCLLLVFPGTGCESPNCFLGNAPVTRATAPATGSTR